MDIREAQARMDAIAQDQGFSQADVSRQFNYMYGEVAGAFDAWNKGKPNQELAHELADVFNNVVRIASMTGIDLEKAVEGKQAIVAARVYERGRGTGMVKREREDREAAS